MAWGAFILGLLQFFGPFLKELLEDLFTKAEPKLTLEARPVETRAAIKVAFAAARKQLWPWQLFKHRQLNKCEEIALRRHAELTAHMTGATAARITDAEAEEILKA